MSSLKASTGAKDPDELLKQEGGRELFDQMIRNAVDAIDYRFRPSSRQDGVGSVSSARSRIIEEELGRLVDLGLDNVVPLRKQMIVKKIAHLLGVDEAPPSMPAMPRPAVAPSRRRPVPQPNPLLPRRTASPARARDAREHLLGCIMLDPALVLALEPGTEWVIAPRRLSSPRRIQQVAMAIGRLAAQGAPAPDLRTVLASLVDMKGAIPKRLRWRAMSRA